MSYILAPNKEMLTPLLTFCLPAHKFCLRAYLVLRGAYTGLHSPFFSYATPLQGALPEHEHMGLERRSNGAFGYVGVSEIGVPSMATLRAKWSKFIGVGILHFQTNQRLFCEQIMC
jgi:hypothetical protein